MIDRIQYWHAYVSFRTELVNFWFVDCRWVHQAAIAHQELRFVLLDVPVFGVVLHKLVIEVLVDHTQICVLAVMLMNQLLERHC